jgi:hypothetical protein
VFFGESKPAARKSTLKRRNPAKKGIQAGRKSRAPASRTCKMMRYQYLWFVMAQPTHKRHVCARSDWPTPGYCRGFSPTSQLSV